MALDERRALALLCRDIEELRIEFARPDHPPELLASLNSLAKDAQAGRTIAWRLSTLLGPLLPGYRSVGPFPGLGPGHADGETFVCPDGRCDLVQETMPAGPAPRCHLLGKLMPRSEPT